MTLTEYLSLNTIIIEIVLQVNGVEIDPWLAGVEGEEVGECGVALCPPSACHNGATCIQGPGSWTCRCPAG